VDPGFDTNGAVTLRISRAPGAEFASFLPEVVRRVSALPGVQSAGAVHNIPLGGSNTNGSVYIDGVITSHAETAVSEEQVVAGDYFAAMGVRLREGRLLREREPGKVVLVNEAFARRFFPKGSALGHSVRAGDGADDPLMEIVGVVGDVRQSALTEPVRPEYYEPFSQNPVRVATLVVRGAGDLPALARAVAAEVARLDPDQPVFAVQPLSTLAAAPLAQRRTALTLLTAFSLVALLLSALGIYGVISLSVEQRRREIGVRMALGADVGGVIRMVVAQGMRTTLVGVVIGGLLGFALAPLLRSILFGVGSADPASHAGAAAVLCAAALFACWLPARRAARVDPAIALHAE
jgi:predicted permease